MSNVRFIDWLRDYVAADEYRRLPAEELWLRVRDSGNENAFHEVVERLGPRALQICRGVLADRHLAEDAFQETFLRLAQRRHSIPTFVNARAWVRTAARLTANHMRRGRRRKTSREQSLVDVATQIVRPEPDEFDRLSVAMQELPERYRRPLELVYWDGLSHAEAATQLGWSKGTVDSYVSRGLQKLRKRLGIPTTVALSAMLAAPAPAIPPTLIASLAVPLPIATASWGVGKLTALSAIVLLSASGLGWGLQDSANEKPEASNRQPILIVAKAMDDETRFRDEIVPQMLEQLKKAVLGNAATVTLVSADRTATRCDVRFACVNRDERDGKIDFQHGYELRFRLHRPTRAIRIEMIEPKKPPRSLNPSETIVLGPTQLFGLTLGKPKNVEWPGLRDATIVLQKMGVPDDVAMTAAIHDLRRTMFGRDATPEEIIRLTADLRERGWLLRSHAEWSTTYEPYHAKFVRPHPPREVARLYVEKLYAKGSFTEQQIDELGRLLTPERNGKTDFGSAGDFLSKHQPRSRWADVSMDE